MFENQTILITGGTGSWGHQLTRSLLKFNPREVRILSRGEFAQVQMQRTFGNHPSLRFIIGDVRDYEAIYEACRGVDYVFHLAALKHVPICEQQPEEALKTNVVGTQNVIRASLQCKVKKVVDVSTDKGVEPINFYGISKALGEKLILQANQLSETTRFVCIRGGNVLGSNGSVVPLFIRQIQENGKITITSKEMTRFFLTIEEAINLLIYAATVSIGGETFVIKMRSCRIADLAAILSANYAKAPVPLMEIGIRPGEKVHEVLVSRYEAGNAYKFSEQYYVILPSHAPVKLKNAYAKCPKFEHSSYESNMNLISPDDIRDLLERGGFLE